MVEIVRETHPTFIMTKPSISLLIIGLLCSLNVFSETVPQTSLAPGYNTLTFDAPKVGSYTLPIIDTATNGEILTTKNQISHLHDLMGDKIVLLSFIYATCGDVNGCPLATMVFHKINRRLQQEPELAGKLRLLTLSFNPEHDTPEAMSRYGSGFINEKVDWQFLTTQSEQKLQPILEEYQQSIQKVYDTDGKFTGTFSHILRVYLIDHDKNIRNIYSVSFLHADTLINDVKTLLKEIPTLKVIDNNTKSLFQAGDNKDNYTQSNYQTNSISLAQRQGKSADLLSILENPPLGLPAVPVPANNPINSQKIALGRKLFYDRRLSFNNTISCAMCHVPEQGFSSQEMATAVGIEGRSVRRNSQTIYNTAYANPLFHDGRETTLEQQAWSPLLAINEMGNPSVGHVISKIESIADYKQLFEQVFSAKPDMLNIGQAIASYERTLISADSDFDRWYFAQQANAVNDSVKRGFKLFTGKANCSACHSIEKSFALFTDNQLHNTGVGYQESMHKTAAKLKIQLAPGVFVEVDNQDLLTFAEDKINDLGLYEITQDPQDRWKYKTPSLRNVALTAPYMHNGSISTLTDVVKFYSAGGINNQLLDSRIKPLDLRESEINDLVFFLEALTGSNVAQLVSDAYAAPIGQ